MGDTRIEIRDGLDLAANELLADQFDKALTEMARLNDRFTIPPMAALLDRTRELKRKKDRTPADLEPILNVLRRLSVEMGPS